MKNPYTCKIYDLGQMIIQFDSKKMGALENLIKEIFNEN